MGIFGTRAGYFSDVSLILEFFVTAAFFLGFYFARSRKITYHYKTMLSAFLLDVSFMVSYMVKSLIEGRTEFTGEEFVKVYVYLPTVVFHSVISLVVLFLAAYMIYHGFKNTSKVNGRKMLEEREKRRHHKIGKITILTWILSFASGLAVYYLLYVY